MSCVTVTADRDARGSPCAAASTVASSVTALAARVLDPGDRAAAGPPAASPTVGIEDDRPSCTGREHVGGAGCSASASGSLWPSTAVARSARTVNVASRPGQSVSRVALPDSVVASRTTRSLRSPGTGRRVAPPRQPVTRLHLGRDSTGGLRDAVADDTGSSASHELPSSRHGWRGRWRRGRRSSAPASAENFQCGLAGVVDAAGRCRTCASVASGSSFGSGAL